MIRYLLGACLIAVSLLACAGESPAIGSPAPAFNLQDQNGDWHKLEDYRGTWLAVYFYPRDGTPGCTTEACSFRDNIYAFKAIGAEVVGVSVDDVESHQKFATEYKLPFILLADVGGKVSDSYGVLRDYQAMQISDRQSFLVSPEGVIVKHYSEVDPEVHTAHVLEDLKELMAAKDSAGN